MFDVYDQFDDNKYGMFSLSIMLEQICMNYDANEDSEKLRV